MRIQAMVVGDNDWRGSATSALERRMAIEQWDEGRKLYTEAATTFGSKASDRSAEASRQNKAN